MLEKYKDNTFMTLIDNMNTYPTEVISLEWYQINTQKYKSESSF